MRYEHFPPPHMWSFAHQGLAALRSVWWLSPRNRGLWGTFHELIWQHNTTWQIGGLSPKFACHSKVETPYIEPILTAVQQLAAWQEGCCMAASLNSRIKVASGELHERGEFCRLYDCLGNIKDSAGANMCKHRVFWNWLTTSNISCRYNAHDTLIDMHIYLTYTYILYVYIYICVYIYIYMYIHVDTCHENLWMQSTTALTSLWLTC